MQDADAAAAADSAHSVTALQTDFLQRQPQGACRPALLTFTENTTILKLHDNKGGTGKIYLYIKHCVGYEPTSKLEMFYVSLVLQMKR